MTFEDWWEKQGIWPSEYTAACAAWQAAQQAERERIRSRIEIAEHKVWLVGSAEHPVYIGPQKRSMEKFVNELLGEGDDRPIPP
jgi:hypothetical protein